MTESTTETLLKTLHEEALQGEKAENGFKKKAWITARAALRDLYGIELEVSQLKSRWANLKKDYEIFTTIENNSGFGWDKEKEIPTAPDSVWDSYLKAYPEAEKFRYHGLLHFAVLDELCMNVSNWRVCSYLEPHISKYCRKRDVEEEEEEEEEEEKEGDINGKRYNGGAGSGVQRERKSAGKAIA
ncbi:hypothetical protein C7212DRAFT_345150 [Tuber magnatum]|uniref:Myb/SANT-like domain-containing protein n=1 Tax=Tuber magnatum TaxID=42249 RepID=A0A317SV93_9PEZI|nr:hypothetical protein C7212DRAFT_345150 [Tuber magnatum]